MGALIAKVNELKGRDPGAYPEDPMVVKAGGEEAVGAVLAMPLAMPASPYMQVIDKAATDICYKSQLIARDQKLSSGLAANAILGMLAGLIVVIVFLLPLIYWALLYGGAT